MNIYSELSDGLLVDLLKKQDSKAFTELYNRYWGVMFSHARRMVKDDDLARDTVQDIFSNLWEKRGKNLTIESSISGYLYKSLRYKIINLIQRQRVREDYLGHLESWLDSSHNDVANLVETLELNQIIESEIDNLPPKMKEIFLMSRSAYLSYKEIAEKTNISEGTVKKQIYYALKILKSKIIYTISLTTMKFIFWLYLK
ncbi:RNA polymerase sigma factor [Sphingobacterium sp. LRF_L2]|uniref:RNA polymerase sigma factor n=1 Tax=Sphingobacterium sp. LRF_L2 TaxID=3369421 RepID=UPI003F613C44